MMLMTMPFQAKAGDVLCDENGNINSVLQFEWTALFIRTIKLWRVRSSSMLQLQYFTTVSVTSVLYLDQKQFESASDRHLDVSLELRNAKWHSPIKECWNERGIKLTTLSESKIESLCKNKTSRSTAPILLRAAVNELFSQV